MKKSDSEKYEKDYAEREKDHDAREQDLEKMLLAEINTYLEKNEKISKDIFDRFSHELRTPIVTIKSYTDMILNGAYGDLTPVQKEKLSRVKENTESLIDTIMKMLEKIKERQ